MDVTQFAAAIAVVIGNGVFYKLYVDRLDKMEKQYEAQAQQFRDELARVYAERDEYKGLFVGMVKDSTKTRKSDADQRRIDEVNNRKITDELPRPPSLPPPNSK